METHSTPVVVTGAGSFIGSHIVEQLLAKGYTVRGTVRKIQDAKNKHLIAFQQKYGKDKLQLVEADLLHPGSFDEIVKNVHVVMHVASPFILDAPKDVFKEIIEPAVQGTLNVLKSCSKAGVKKIILTSSIAAITESGIPMPKHELAPNRKIFNEKDWNQVSSPTMNPYYYSKKKAEEEAWNYMKQFPSIEFIVLNPVLVWGPSHFPNVNTSVSLVELLLKGEFPAFLNFKWNVIDVRDVAAAHIAAMEKKDLKTGRYLLSHRLVSMRYTADVLRRYLPLAQSKKLPSLSLENGVGNWIAYMSGYLKSVGMKQFIQSNIGKVAETDNSKSWLLDLKFTPIEKTIVDTAQNLFEHGLLPSKM